MAHDRVRKTGDSFMKLDNIDHIAVTAKNIKNTTQWYLEHFGCSVLYEDETWALIKFGNLKLALVNQNQHPPHFAIRSDTPEDYGHPVTHRDGSESVYITDPDGNAIEMIRYP
jgi:catechol-2,3-dioxygenase